MSGGSSKSHHITGAGDLFLNAGDWDWVSKQTEEEWLRWAREGKWIIHDALTVPQPIVIGLNGKAMGMGATLVALGDVIIAAEGALIGDHHATYGLASGNGGQLLYPLSMA